MAPGPTCSGNNCTYQYLDREFVPDYPMDIVLHQLPWVPDEVHGCCNPKCEEPVTPWYDTVEMCGGMLLGVDAVLDLTRWEDVITVDTADIEARETIFAIEDDQYSLPWDSSICSCGLDLSRPEYGVSKKVELNAGAEIAIAMRGSEINVSDWFDTSYGITSTLCLSPVMEGPLFLTHYEDAEFPNANGSSGGRLHFGTGGRVVDSNGRSETTANQGTSLRFRVTDVLTASANNGALISCDGSGVVIKLPDAPLTVAGTTALLPIDVTVTTATETRRLRINQCPALT